MTEQNYNDDINECKSLIEINNELFKNTVRAIHQKTTGPRLIVLTPEENEKIQDLNPKQYQNFIRYMREYYPFKIAYIKAKNL